MTKANFTSIAVILDQSGSMAGLQKDTIGGFNTFLREQKELPGEATLTLALFSDTYHLIHDGAPLENVPELTEGTYRPSGSTALLDAIGRTFDAMGHKFSAQAEADRPSKVLVLIMTDGEENASTDYKHAKIKEMIKHQQEKYSWSIVYVGANVDAFSMGSNMGIASGSSYNYTSSSIGTQSLYSNLSKGASAYRNSAVGTSFTMVDPTQGISPIPAVPVVSPIATTDTATGSITFPTAPITQDTK